ncbi:hypothetical protein Tco_1029102 [Tanacetum coccineum]|uniref:Retrovirus-related Pol polyprotein from transposon TNT 1-94-like beta-barrel domain-containing protein n=1 Tax=Tanacetum coccineum TaxID=301880 RepID=A0ABQ5G2R4_9ASTR
MAFISSSNTSSEKSEVSTVQGVSTDNTDVVAASLSHDTVCAFIATQPNGSQIKYEDIFQIDDDDIEEMDIKWNLALLSMRADTFCYIAEEDEASKNHALVANEEEVPTEYALMAKSSSSSDNEVEARLVEFKENEIKLCEKIRVLERDIELKDNKIEYLRNELEEYSVVPPPPAQVYSPPKKDLSWMGLPEFVDDTDYSRPTPSANVSKDVSAFSLEQRGSFDNVVPKSMIKFVKETSCPSLFKDNNTKNPRKSTVKPKIPTVGSKVSTAKPTVAADKGNKGKAVKASARWIWKPKKNSSSQGSNFNGVSVTFKKYQYIDTQGRLNGCSRHMTGNISYLSEYEPFNRGYVSFGHERGKITGKCSIKTGKLDFDNVYFVEELKYNLFSVSQICDNKNSVLFTDSECIVLGKDFKLVDDKHERMDASRPCERVPLGLDHHPSFLAIIGSSIFTVGSLSEHTDCQRGIPCVKANERALMTIFDADSLLGT